MARGLMVTVWLEEMAQQEMYTKSVAMLNSG